MERTQPSKESIVISSFGGTGGIVTGSNHLVEAGYSKVLVDMGLFQGNKNDEKRNFEPISKIARGVTDVIITHAHIDHIGRVAMLYKEGFTPTTHATYETMALMDPMLRNSVKIQSLKKKVSEQMYDLADVDKTMRHVKGADAFKQRPIGQKHSGMTNEFMYNGHMTGSASVLIRCFNIHKNVLFTGDIGRPEQQLCGGYLEYAPNYPNDQIDAMVVESTNFEKESVSFDEKYFNFMDAINKVWKEGGNPVLPVLSLRAQEIIEILHHGQESGEIPADCKIIIDAPLAMTLLNVIREMGSDCLTSRFGNEPNFYKTAEESMARFDLKNVKIVKSHKESLMVDEKMANYQGKLILLTGGGMVEHGRVVNYTKGEFRNNPKNAIILTCYQAEGTAGERMLEEEKSFRDKKIEKQRAKTIKIEGFTSHACRPEIIDYIGRFNLKRDGTIIITHGQNSAREAMAKEIEQIYPEIKTIRSDIGQRIII